MLIELPVLFVTLMVMWLLWLIIAIDIHIDDDIDKTPLSKIYETGYTLKELFVKDKMKRVAKRELEWEVKVGVKNDLRTIIRIILFKIIVQLYTTLLCLYIFKFFLIYNWLILKNSV